MVKEEYKFCDITAFLDEKTDLLISGFPNTEERSKFFYEKWIVAKKDVLLLARIGNEELQFNVFSFGVL